MIDGYNFFRHDRLDKEGGGIGVHIRTHFSVSRLLQCNTNCENTPEFVVLEVTHKSFKVFVAVVYRRPTAAFPKHFFAIVTRDFNINLCTPSAASITSFAEPSMIPRFT